MKKQIAVVVFLLISMFKGFSQNSGITLESFESSECIEEEHFFSLQNRIVFQEFTDSLCVIEIAVTANCCDGEMGRVEVLEDTIKLFYQGQEYPEMNNKGDTIAWSFESCDCNCCFHFTYHIKGLKQKNYTVLADNKKIEYSAHKHKTQPIDFELVNGDTINFYDSYGFKQGVHVLKNKKGKAITRMYYIDNKAYEGLYVRRFYDSGELRMEVFKKNGEFSKEIEYYKNGKIMKECEIKELFDENPKCVTFDEEGNQINK